MPCLRYILLLMLLANASHAIDAVNLTVDGRTAPLAVDRAQPVLGWQVVGPRGTMQSAWRVQVASSVALLAVDSPDLWDSGKVTSAASQQVAYAGSAPSASQAAFWRVRLWDAAGLPGPWSAIAFWERGLATSADWSDAAWITAPVTAAQSPLLRTTFTLAKPVRRARLSICGLGYFEAFLNGGKVGDEVLAPGVASHHQRSYYQTFDVTELLSSGANALAVELANGSLRGLTQGGHPSWASDSAWLSTPRLICKLLVEHADGCTATVVSSPAWRWTTGPVQANDYYRAVTYDARAELPGWTTAAFDDRAWSQAQISAKTSAMLEAQHYPPCRVVESLAPTSLTARAGTTASGAPATVYRCEFAKNLAGWVQLLDLTAPAGTDLHLAYYEPTDYQQWDRYICRGGGAETWEPRFTYHGFRYADITVPDASGLVLTAANVRARRVHTDFPQAGDFACSNPVFTRLLDAFRLSYLGNFHSIPTDCPTREKAGWMADAHLVAEAGLFLFGNRTAYDKFLRDCLDAQISSGPDVGAVPSVVPSQQFNAGTSNDWGGPAWSAAYPMIVWTLYQHTGDQAMLALHLPRLKQYAHFIANRLCVKNPDPLDDGRIVTLPGLGDWGGSDKENRTSRELIATSYHHVAVRIVADAAAALGNAADAAAYGQRAASICERFNRRFRSAAAGSYMEPQPRRAQVCALFQGLVPEADRQVTAKLMADGLSTDWTWMGCLTPRWMLQELSRSGHIDQAYAAVARTDTNWAKWTEIEQLTTLREFWNGGTFNHAFMGMFATWYLEDVLGLRPDARHPGFAQFAVVPQMPTALTWANGWHDSVRGRISVAWTRSADAITLAVTVPGNCKATIHLPAKSADLVRETGRPLAQVTGLTIVGRQGDRLVVSVPAGAWDFAIATGRLR